MWDLELLMGRPVFLTVCKCLQWGRPGFDPWVGKIPWRRKWQPTPVLLPRKSHGRRSLVPWGCKELDTTEWLHFKSCGPVYVCTHTCIYVCNFSDKHLQLYLKGVLLWTLSKVICKQRIYMIISQINTCMELAAHMGTWVLQTMWLRCGLL